MGKDLVPRFVCPLCGWLAYYSMLDGGPYKLEIRGMKYDGFQKISYHHVWGGKKEYKEFLRMKVRELVKELGLKLADEEEEITGEEEMEVEPVERVQAERPLRQIEKSSVQVMEIPAERVDSVLVEHADRVQQRSTSTFKEWFAAYAKAIEKTHVMTADVEDYVRMIDHEFISVGGDK